jgi:hypothetical protein
VFRVGVCVFASVCFYVVLACHAIAVEFWNAIVNWNIVDEARFSELRAVFIEHEKLKDLLDFMLRRVERKDEESIYFLTLLFDADDFIERFIRDSTLVDVRKKCLDCIFTSLINLLTLLDLAGNPGVLLLEALVSVGGHVEGRKLLLHDWHKQLLELVGLFVAKFDIMTQRLEADQSLSPQPSSAHMSTKKLFGLFFRLYGAIHDDEHLFVQYLLDHFCGSRGALKLKEHLQVFQNSELLKDNDTVETEDKDKYYFLFLAFRKRIEAKEHEETGGGAGGGGGGASSALLSRSVVERFKSMHSVGFKLPFALACSSTFVTRFQALEKANAQANGASQDVLVATSSHTVAKDVEKDIAEDGACDMDENMGTSQVDAPKEASTEFASLSDQKALQSQDSGNVDARSADAGVDGSQTLKSGEVRKRKATETDAASASEALDTSAAEAAEDGDHASGVQDRAEPTTVSAQQMSASSTVGCKGGASTGNDAAAKKRMRTDGTIAQGLSAAQDKLEPVFVSDDDEDYDALSEPEFIDPAEWESDTDDVSALEEELIVHSRPSLAKPEIKPLNAEKPKAVANNSNSIGRALAATLGKVNASMSSAAGLREEISGREQLRDQLEEARSSKETASHDNTALKDNSVGGDPAGTTVVKTGDAADGALQKSTNSRASCTPSASASQGKASPEQEMREGSGGSGVAAGGYGVAASKSAGGRAHTATHDAPPGNAGNDGKVRSRHAASKAVGVKIHLLQQRPHQLPQQLPQQQELHHQHLQVDTSTHAGGCTRTHAHAQILRTIYGPQQRAEKPRP